MQNLEPFYRDMTFFCKIHRNSYFSISPTSIPQNITTSQRILKFEVFMIFFWFLQNWKGDPQGGGWDLFSTFCGAYNYMRHRIITFLWRTCPYAPQNLGHPMCWLWPTWDPPKSCGALAYMRHRKGIFCGAYVPMRHRISTFLWRTSLHAPQKKILWRTRYICATE